MADTSLEFSIAPLHGLRYVPTTPQFEKLRNSLASFPLSGSVVLGRCRMASTLGDIGPTGCVGARGSSDEKKPEPPKTPIPLEEVYVRVKLNKVPQEILSDPFFAMWLEKYNSFQPSYPRKVVEDMIYYTDITYRPTEDFEHVSKCRILSLTDKGRKILDLMTEEDCDVYLHEFYDRYPELFTVELLETRPDRPEGNHEFFQETGGYVKTGTVTLEFGFPNAAVDDLINGLVEACQYLTRDTPNTCKDDVIMG